MAEVANVAENLEERNLISKLNEASKNIGPIGKDGKNSYQNYSFQSETAIKYAVEEAIRQAGIRIIPTYVVLNQYDRSSKKGGSNHFVDVMGTFTITDGNESILGTMPGSGQDSGEKAMAKACTSAQKYFYKQLFNITDKDEDPDSEDSGHGGILMATEGQQTTLISLFKTMAEVKDAAPKVVSNGYLEKAGVAQVADLTHESANKLIELVTRHLKIQSENEGK
ncbi:ERF family protein [Levilactobacillus wangkuiensis]|uniref:ERF family protein n=1 Tax=Levilactobacillus wangkuiensis TaxID=2799566 RepID=UPI001941CBA6|nr:ERF family protein [Levilactobacillus wangkuiensis]